MWFNRISLVPLSGIICWARIVFSLNNDQYPAVQKKENSTFSPRCTETCKDSCKEPVLQSTLSKVMSLLLHTGRKTEPKAICNDTCPESWRSPFILKGRKERSCYRILSQELLRRSLTWEDSRDRCQAAGGDLVSIETREEQEHIMTLGTPKFCYWTSGRYDIFARKWSWAATGEEVQYENWAKVLGLSRGALGHTIILDGTKELPWKRLWKTSNCDGLCEKTRPTQCEG